MNEDNILYELSTRNVVGFLHKELIQITEKGVVFTNTGLASAIAKESIFIPYDQIAAVEVLKLFLGIQVNFIITSTSGKKLRLQQVDKEQAERAKEIIYEAQKKSINSNLKNFDSNNNTSSNIVSEKIDVADQLLKLSNLKDAGIISQDEFDSQKRKLLGM
jgi:hypothetical protein